MTDLISKKALLAVASLAATAGAGFAASPANAASPAAGAPILTETLSAPDATPDTQGDLTAPLTAANELDVTVGYGIAPAGPSDTAVGPSGSLDCGVPGDTPMTFGQMGPNGFSGAALCTYRTPGTYVVTLKSTDNLTPAHLSSMTRLVTVTSAPPLPVDRYDGATRYGTGVALSYAEFPKAGSADAVVLARGDVFADALAGIPLAKAKNGPLLLTPGGAAVTQLNPYVQEELARVLPRDHDHTVYILGGVGAISQPVQDRIASLGYNVVRLAGGSRYQTALAIARDPRALNNPAHVVLARGDDYADALASGPLAANGFKDSHGTPAAIVLSDGPATAATVDSATAAYVQSKMTSPADHGAAEPATLTGNVIAVGGGAQKAAAGLGGASMYQAFSGSDRYDTARVVAVNGWQAPAVPSTGQHAYFKSARLGVAVGTSFADALTGGSYMALENGPLLLSTTNHLPPITYTTLRQDALEGVGRIAAFGGPSVLSDGVVQTEIGAAVRPLIISYVNYTEAF